MYRVPYLPVSPFRKRPAFSLVEVLVVMTLIGIAAALSIPKVSKLSNQAKIQRAAQALRLEVQQAFAIAGRNRAPVRIKWSSANMQVQTTNLAGSTVYRRLGLGAGGGYNLLSSEVSVVPTTLTVFPNGLADDTLVFSLTRSGYSRRIWVSKSGMVRVQ
jgi:prepilin-type N-terminal cleavage/methylation domain-containing protein